MKPSNWIQFTWDLSALTGSGTELPEHYQIVPATPEDEKELRRVISSSFTLDPTWNPALQEITQTIEAWLDRANESGTIAYLALRHGTRMIGAAVISLDPSAESNLLPGPCVLMEYRNRGFGTLLLERSLLTLREAGFERASAIGMENSPVTKFLYPKFQSTQAPHDFTAALAA